MVDYRIELVGLPVDDVDRAKEFYGDTLGWPVDHDHTVSDDVRFIQVTPPGSACSIAFGKGVSDMPAGSLRALQVVVSSADEARADLVARGVEASEVDDQPWGRFVHFADPDGNTWSVQELPDYSQLGDWQADAGVTDNQAGRAPAADPNFGVVPDR